MSVTQYKQQLFSFLQVPRVKLIQESGKFYFQKAIDKYNEYINLKIDLSTLNTLIDKSKAKSFSYKNY